MVGMKNFTPDQVRSMSLVEISAAIDGFAEFNGGKGDKFADIPTLEEIEAEEEAQKTMRNKPRK